MPSVRLPGFTPKANGLHFRNAFPPNPIRQFRLGNVATLNVGDAANGLCGGMSFVVRDLCEHDLMPPADVTPPPGGTARFDYIVNRQIDSFDNGLVPARFFKLMDPARPATEPPWAELLGRFGIDRHSRTWVTTKVEWPAIQRDIDGGSLATIGLVKVVGRDPLQLGQNHQVLAYGYDLTGSRLTLRVYDPNRPRRDDVALSLDVANPTRPTRVTTSPSGPEVFAFFRTAYRAAPPP